MWGTLRLRHHATWSPVQKCHQTVCVPPDRHVTELASTSRKKSRKFIQQQTSAKQKAGDLQWCGWRQQQHVRAKKVHATVNTVPQEKLIPFKFALYGMDWNGEMCPKWTHQEAGPTANPNYHTDWGNNIYILRGHHIPEKTSKWAPQFSLFARNNPSNSHSEIIDFDYIQLAWQVIWSEAMVMPANVYHCWTNQLQATFWCAPCLSPVLRLAPCCDGSPIWLGGSGIHPEGHLSFTIAYPCIYSSWYTEPRCSRVRLTWCQICLIFWFVRYLVAYVPTNILKPCIYQMTCLISSI